MDSKTIFLKYFTYDGRGGDGVHFWVGNGPQPDRKGHIVPNERGYLEPLGRYDALNGKSVRLQLPGNLTVFDINWFSIFDTKVSRYVARANTVYIGFCDYGLSGQSGFSDQ